MEKQDSILKEDGNSGYSKVKNYNIVRLCKKKNNLEYFFNYALSSDFSLIENY